MNLHVLGLAPNRVASLGQLVAVVLTSFGYKTLRRGNVILDRKVVDIDGDDDDSEEDEKNLQLRRPVWSSLSYTSINLTTDLKVTGQESRSTDPKEQHRYRSCLWFLWSSGETRGVEVILGPLGLLLVADCARSWVNFEIRASRNTRRVATVAVPASASRSSQILHQGFSKVLRRASPLF
ncbi:hypothetical protein F2Q70_00044902 [Brassica cretica]|uniref:Uncharacterized protein n=1 Tax=Brassica cretica TaxID=69181 RepID=A0A8S9KE78_BRACR|nr:hypothetical protein F2Q70_00044902 [Brassica cretica]